MTNGEIAKLAAPALSATRGPRRDRLFHLQWRRLALCAGAGLLPAGAVALPAVSCTVEYNDERIVMPLRPDPDALGGSWREVGVFSVRAALSAPPGVTPWLQVEVLAKAADGDDRIISSQKVRPPYDSGRMEVVEPRLGRVLRYSCGARP